MGVPLSYGEGRVVRSQVHLRLDSLRYACDYSHHSRGIHPLYIISAKNLK